MSDCPPAKLLDVSLDTVDDEDLRFDCDPPVPRSNEKEPGNEPFNDTDGRIASSDPDQPGLSCRQAETTMQYRVSDAEPSFRLSSENDLQALRAVCDTMKDAEERNQAQRVLPQLKAFGARRKLSMLLDEW